MHAILYEQSLGGMKMIGSWKRGYVDTSRITNYASNIMPWRFFFGHLEVHDYRIYYVNIDLRHHYGVSLAEAQTSLPSGKERGETAVFAGWDILRKKRV